MKKNNNRLVKIVAIITGIVCFVSTLTIFAAPISNLFTGNAETKVLNETAVETAVVVNEDEIQAVESGTYFVGVTSTKLGDYTGATETYAPGEELPATVKNGDVYVYGDYEYRYNLWLITINDNTGIHSEWRNDSGGEDNWGWCAVALDKTKSSYGEILAEINGEPVTDLYATFKDCTRLTTAPAIPSSVTKMIGTFSGCKNLTTAPTIPNKVKTMQATFAGCKNLTTAPTIPNSVKYLSSTFAGCTSLTNAPVIPSSVVGMGYAFRNCTALTTAPTIPSSVEQMPYAFDGCTSLKNAPAIPGNVWNMNYTFNDCTALTTAPIIPESVTHMAGTFKGCTDLTGEVEINANVPHYPDCFKDTVKTITLTGSATDEKKEALAETSDNGNVYAE